MPVTIKPLTRQQLRQLFADYRTAFPDWAVEHDVVLTRSSGPVAQRIAVEALRSGAYRPSCSIAVNAGMGRRSSIAFSTSSTERSFRASIRRSGHAS